MFVASLLLAISSRWCGYENAFVTSKYSLERLKVWSLLKATVVTSVRRVCWRTKVLQLVACICRTRAHYRKYISLIVSRNVDHVLSTLRLNLRQPSCYIETPSKEIVCVAMFFEPSFSKREKHNTIFLEASKSVEQPFQRSNRLDVKYRRGIFVISRQTSKSC